MTRCTRERGGQHSPAQTASRGVAMERGAAAACGLGAAVHWSGATPWTGRPSTIRIAGQGRLPSGLGADCGPAWAGRVSADRCAPRWPLASRGALRKAPYIDHFLTVF